MQELQLVLALKFGDDPLGKHLSQLAPIGRTSLSAQTAPRVKTL